MFVKIARKVDDEFSKSKLLFLRKIKISSFDPICEYNVIRLSFSFVFKQRGRGTLHSPSLCSTPEKIENNKIKKGLGL